MAALPIPPSSEEDPTPNHGDSPNLFRAASILFAALDKTVKAMALYMGGGDLVKRLLDDLTQRAEEALQEGAITVRVASIGWVLDGKPLLGDDKRRNYLFRMFCDGIRELTLEPGITRDELKALCLTLTTNPRDSNEDLVTLLWQQELEHVDFYVVDVFNTGAAADGLADLALTGGSRKGRVNPLDADGDSEVAMSPDDIRMLKVEEQLLWLEEAAAISKPPESIQPLLKGIRDTFASPTDYGRFIIIALDLADHEASPNLEDKAAAEARGEGKKEAVAEAPGVAKKEVTAEARGEDKDEATAEAPGVANKEAAADAPDGGVKEAASETRGKDKDEAAAGARGDPNEKTAREGAGVPKGASTVASPLILGVVDSLMGKARASQLAQCYQVAHERAQEGSSAARILLEALLEPERMKAMAPAFDKDPSALAPVLGSLATEGPEGLVALLTELPPGKAQRTFQETLLAANIPLTPVYARQLATEDDALIQQALDSLSQIGDEAALVAISSMLSNTRTHIRTSALKAMMGRYHESARIALGRALRDPSPENRRFTIEILKKSGDPKAVWLLLGTVEDRGAIVRDSEEVRALYLALSRSTDDRVLAHFDGLLNEKNLTRDRKVVERQLLAIQALTANGAIEAQECLAAARKRWFLPQKVKKAIDAGLRGHGGR